MAPVNNTEDQAPDDDVSEDQGLARNRSRRTKIDKKGRFAALERLKKAKEKGEKNKYEVVEEENVYDEVAEDQYSDIVRKRQEDDWIVDDDGSGYVEDGREIFDDELDDDVPSKASKGHGKEKKSKNPHIMKPDVKPKSIKNMFMAQKIKKKVEKDVSLDGDDVLGDIMAELHKEPSDSIMPAPVKFKKKTPKAVYNPFAATQSQTTPKQLKQRAPSFRPSQTWTSGDQSPKSTPKARKLAPKQVFASSSMSADNVDDSPRIEEDNSEDVEKDMSENIEDDTQGMDVGDINFDDDMDDGNSAEKENSHTENLSHTNSQKSEIQQEKPKLPKNLDFSSWETESNKSAPVVKDVQVDASKLPLTTNEEGEQVLRFYWLDAYEDYFKQPGVVYLFGKVWIESAETYVSCSVAVKNIERKMYILPRKNKFDMNTKLETNEPVTFVDMYEEFYEKVTSKYKINKFKSRKVTKQYAFEIADIPVESDYLEVRYTADQPALPADLAGSTFSHVFGTKTSSLELLILDRKLKGPCWIDVKVPQIPSPPVSWCKVEAYVSRPECITVTTSSPNPPPLVTMTMNLRTLPNPKTHQNEIIAVACLVHHSLHMDKPAPKKQLFQQHFCALSKPADCIFPFDFKDRVLREGKGMNVEIMGTERALLGFILAKIHKIDPDIIVGHDVFGFDLDVLLQRINANKIPHWSRLGRLKRANMPKLNHGSGGRATFAETTTTCGRMICDINISAKELIRCRSYDLTELTSHILKQKRAEVNMDEIKNIYNATSDILQFVNYTLQDSQYILQIMYELNVIPLALQITNICGNVMARTLMGGRAERNEYLLLHAFTEKDFIVPDKQYGKKKITVEAEDEDDAEHTGGKKSGRRKPAYAGGLVLEPKKGFYDKYILMLDFNSLYPSIIQEYNICFTTISKSAALKHSEETEEDDFDLQLPEPDLDPGILPTEIRKLVQSRRQVKQLMKTPDLSADIYMQYDIRQKALKLTANSMYGCLGFTYSRFYAKPLAALVTGKGREILLKTKDLVQTMNLDVIYGDTDSIMINTNCTDIDQVFKLGNKIKSEVNKLYRLLEIDIDGVYKSMLLLKKKKYAALNVQKVGDKYVTSQELKGLDIVRRDWCELAKEAGNYIVSQILCGESREAIVENIHTKLIDVGEKVKEGKIPVELYQITKSLTKNPEDYPDKKSLPHVQVALRINSKGGKRLKAGDAVYYVICEDGSTLPASQRAYHPEELAKSDSLKIDTKYYLAQQVHPVVARLCDPIDGTDAAHIAECLGLDPSGYQHHHRNHDDEDNAMLGGGRLSEEERFKDCDRFKFRCPNSSCNRETIIDSVFTGSGSVIDCSLARCPNNQCESVPADFVRMLQNHISQLIRAHIKKYYESWLSCDDSTCNHRTRRLPLTFQRGQPVCQACNRGILRPEYTDTALYDQLCFYQYIFDIDKAISALDEKDRAFAKMKSKDVLVSYRTLKQHVERRIKQSAYSQVDLNRLFEGLAVYKQSSQ